MAEECLFSEMTLDSVGQDEGDDVCGGWSFHPFNKLLLGTCCVPRIDTRAHAVQNSITDGKATLQCKLVLKYLHRVN